MGNKSYQELLVRINNVYGRKAVAAFALCQKYAEWSKQILQERQGTAQEQEGEFWTNRTSLAIRSAQGYAKAVGKSIGWGLSHRVEYGPYLELANNRSHEALRPVVYDLIPEFLSDLKKIYAE